jgi:transposase-like protein
MRKHRSYPVEFKRQVAQEYLAGETLHGLAKELTTLLVVRRQRQGWRRVAQRSAGRLGAGARR